MLSNDESLVEALGGNDGQLIIKEGKARIDDDLFLRIETNLTLPIITRNFFKSQFYKRYPHTRPEHFDLINNSNNDNNNDGYNQTILIAFKSSNDSISNIKTEYRNQSSTNKITSDEKENHNNRWIGIYRYRIMQDLLRYKLAS